jgi:hypothetical protein
MCAGRNAFHATNATLNIQRPQMLMLPNICALCVFLCMTLPEALPAWPAIKVCIDTPQTSTRTTPWNTERKTG